MVKLKHNLSLRNFSTMRLGGRAAHLTKVKSAPELIEAITWAQDHKVAFIVIGKGSNIVWSDDGFKGLVIVNEIKGFKLSKNKDGTATLTVSAGEDWDKTVEKTVKKGWHGIECLSLIPGTAGATPVQNVGAYGQEIKDTLLSVEVYDTELKKVIPISNADCGFGYRTSRFKTSDKGRYAILNLTLRLTKERPIKPFYRALEDYFVLHDITKFSPKVIRSAVIDIRKSKLPDPKEVANNGSFFANPLVSASIAKKLLSEFPDMPNWPDDNNKIKLSSAWMIQQIGYKNYHDKETGMATWANQPLVLVNESAKFTADLLKFKKKIVIKVKNKFGIELEQEPEYI